MAVSPIVGDLDTCKLGNFRQMHIKSLIWIAALCSSNSVFGQLAVTEQCAAHKRSLFSAAKTSVADVLEDSYDIKHVKLDVALSNENVHISGSVTVDAKVITANMATYTFELAREYTIDSVTINGTSQPVASNNNVRTVTLGTPLTAGSIFAAQIYYQGSTEPGNGYFQKGLNNTDANPFLVKTTYTLSEPYMASQWWPCKQSLQDKIDSADIWITVPGNLMAGSNGVLRKVTTLPNGIGKRYEWHTNYPIAYYLVSAAVAPYIDYSYKITVPGSNDSLLVQNFIYDAPGALAGYRNGIDSTAYMLQYFSGVFGPYPFIKEKYGHCIVPLPGGMENQTMTSLGDFGTNLVSHELAHQWFGDHVTCSSWKDIWLNEGFASYAEYMFLQAYRPDDAPAHILDFQNIVLKNKEKRGSVYVDDTSDASRIFDGRLTYAKGATVLHMLRYIAGDDSVFYKILKTYRQQYAFSNATTENFKAVAEQVLQQDLTTFFDQWIYKEGYPIYKITWNQVGFDLFIKVTQSTSVPQSVSVFRTPLELQLQSPGANASYTFDNNANEQIIRLTHDKRITGIVADPRNWLLNADEGNYRDPELGINEVTSNGVMVWPNPATEYWSVTGMPVNTDWVLTDINGKIVLSGNTGTQTGKVIYNSNMAFGVYMLDLLQGKKKIKSIKLIKG